MDSLKRSAAEEAEIAARRDEATARWADPTPEESRAAWEKFLASLSDAELREQREWLADEGYLSIGFLLGAVDAETNRRYQREVAEMRATAARAREIDAEADAAIQRLEDAEHYL